LVTFYRNRQALNVYIKKLSFGKGWEILPSAGLRKWMVNWFGKVRLVLLAI
jgi:hypothetical protein